MRRRLILAATAAAVTIAGTVNAFASLAQPTVVLTNPVDNTPNVMDGTVYAIAKVGNTIVVGGDFTSVTNASGSTTYARKNIFSYDLTTGAVTGFAPALDGGVLAL